MKKLLNPKWIFLINTLPILVLFLLFYREYQVVHTLLKEQSITLWKNFGVILALLGILNFGYAIFLTLKKKPVSVYYAFIALLSYITFIFIYNTYYQDIIPFSIPRWMISEDLFFYVGTFLMPTLAYSVFISVVHFTPEAQNLKARKSFLIAIAIPIIFYIFSQVILPLWKIVDSRFFSHTSLILIIIATILFLFFLVRGVLILVTKKGERWKKYTLVWKIPVTIILPIVALIVNNQTFGFGDAGLFGDFLHYWFYVIAIVNGVLLCLPNTEKKQYRLFLFIGRSITFSFIFYFFLVVLPFLPLALIALVFVGLGFLLLLPLVLFIIHINQLSKDIRYLKTLFSKNLIRAISIVGFLLIPFFIHISYVQDKNTLNQTLEYIYSPDYSKEYKIDKASLQKTLDIIKGHKDGRSGGLFGSQQPYLSTYFNWLVLDNLTLSDSKITSIEKIFFGETLIYLRPENIRNSNVEVSNITTKSSYDPSQKAWKSWIDLEITNMSDNNRLSEYATTFELPEGAWISNYYLYVGERKEMGILAEKKAAMWIFSSIRNENRDPGILYYLTGNKIAFRVFPFAEKEVRKTGIEILHKEPIQFNLDGNSITLGNVIENQNSTVKNANAVYLSAAQKQELKKVRRKPYFHFLVNTTDSTNVPILSNRIAKLMKENPSLSIDAKISFVNSSVSTQSINDEWTKAFQNQSFEGGFYTSRAIKSVLYHSYKEQSNSYPIIVTVTDSIQNAIFEKDFSDWSFSFPETSRFYNLKEGPVLDPHSLISNPKKSINDTIPPSFDHSVLEYKIDDNSTQYLPDNNKPSIVLKNDVFESTETDIKEKNWNSALTMHAKWRSQILHPDTSNDEWLQMVKHIFMSKVMTPVTSYIVVENEAQKASLKKKQEQILSGNKSLDPGEDTERMSEPSLIVLAILLGLILYYRKRKQIVR